MKPEELLGLMKSMERISAESMDRLCAFRLPQSEIDAIKASAEETFHLFKRGEDEPPAPRYPTIVGVSLIPNNPFMGDTRWAQFGDGSIQALKEGTYEVEGNRIPLFKNSLSYGLHTLTKLRID
jgi:hypothetical protein